MLAQPATRLLGQISAELGLAACLDREEGEGSHIMQMAFPGGVAATPRHAGNQHHPPSRKKIPSIQYGRVNDACRI